MNFLVVNRNFNDIDHISPICYKLLENKHKIYIIIVNEYLDYENDYRLKFLIKNGAKVYSILDFSNLSVIKIFFNIMKFFYNSYSYNYNIKKYSFSIMERISKRINFKVNIFFKNIKFDAILFDWCDPLGANSAINSIYSYAKKKNLITFSLPHGLDIYSNGNFALDSNRKQINHSYNNFDYVVSNSNIYIYKLLSNGVKSNKLFMLGSARFNKEWVAINGSLIKSVLVNPTIGKKVLVFMPQHSQYNIDIDKQLKLIKRISELDKYILYFKPHTRNQNEKYFDEVSKLSNVIMANNFLSTELIDIADAIIVYGSSIVLEATIKGKLVLYPKFLHDNETIFEKVGSCELFQSEKLMIKYLKKGLNKNYSILEENECLKVASNPYSKKYILQDYVEFIVEKTKEYNECAKQS